MEKIIAKPLKVVVTGPESTGKTVLCAALAEHFGTNYVPEYAREYLQLKGTNYVEGDLLNIAKGQIQLENKFSQQNNQQLLICDTSLEVIKVWSEWKYRHCHPFIIDQLLQRPPHLYLLLTPDLPWQPDPLRENPHDRADLFAYYQQSFTEHGIKVVEIYGDGRARIDMAINAIDKIIK